jgi:epoxide hydrolase-like predicted phosphatase
MLAISDYEVAHSIPSGYINYAIDSSAPNGAWQKIERNDIPLDSTFFDLFTADLSSRDRWASFHARRKLPLTRAAPPSTINGEELFWKMVAKFHEQDPIVIDAVRRLRESGRYKVGALTNDYKYPDGHPYADRKEITSHFDVFVSSSETGARKPEERFYRIAMERLGVADPREVAFLDDIGTNLKAARDIGWRTIKVDIGKSWEAIRELEKLTGEKLLDNRERGRL